jgi:proteasome-associated ATPase
MLRRLEGVPWFPGTFLGLMPVGSEHGALVACGQARRVVALDGDVDRESLEVGDQVFLGPEQNILVAASGRIPTAWGQLAVFERHLSDERAVLRYRDEELVVRLAGRMKGATLRRGDTMRFDRETALALEKVERNDSAHLFLEDTPSETFGDIGGLDREIRSLTSSVRLQLFEAEAAERYHLRPVKGVLLAGPPGTGKTLMARALANWLAGQAKSHRARFINVKPSGLHSMWYGESEARYRECFRAAREAGRADPDTPCVIFLDEVDSIGEERGGGVHRVNDQVLASLLAELDGLERRDNVLVVGATNRLSAIDPALLRPGRLGDRILDIPRPNRSGAAAILAKYLPEDAPFQVNGHADAGQARQELMASAISRIYDGTGDAVLATLTFRDGTQRSVWMRDVVSGARLANVAREALEAACVREVETGDAGLRPSDIFEAISGEFSRSAGVLTPRNCRSHLWNLPQDLDVVRVERPTGRVAAHTYLRRA